MAESGLDSLRKTRDVAVEWRAFELWPGGQFPGRPEQEHRYREYIREKHEPMWAHAREHFGLEMGEGPCAVNSRPAMVGARYARNQGKEVEYHRACSAAHWHEGRRLDDPNALVEIAMINRPPASLPFGIRVVKLTSANPPLPRSTAADSNAGRTKISLAFVTSKGQLPCLIRSSQ